MISMAENLGNEMLTFLNNAGGDREMMSGIVST